MIKKEKIISVFLAGVIALNAMSIPANAEERLEETVFIDGVEFNIELNDDFDVVVTGETKDSTAAMVLDGEGNATVKLDSELQEEIYELDVQELDSNNVDVSVYNQDGDFIDDYSSIQEIVQGDYKGQVSIAIGGGIVITIGMLLDALIVAGLAVVIGSVLYIVATKFYDTVMAASKTKQEKAKKLYYPAYLWGKKVAIAPKGISKAKAIKRIKKGESVYSFTSSLARSVITAAGYSYTPTGIKGEINSIRKKGGIYLYHYHKKNRDSTHSFYGKPVIG